MEEKSLSWWGDVTTKNKEETIKKNREIIGERLELFTTIKEILEDAGIEFFIEGGTLLGAYRNGQFIYHDNDIDTGCVNKEFVKVGKILDSKLIYDEYLKRKSKYKTRLYLTSGGKEYVPDGRPGQHSPFARRFIEALRNYGGDDGILNVNEIIQFIEKVEPQPCFGEFGDNEPGSDFILMSQ